MIALAMTISLPNVQLFHGHMAVSSLTPQNDVILGLPRLLIPSTSPSIICFSGLLFFRMKYPYIQSRHHGTHHVLESRRWFHPIMYRRDSDHFCPWNAEHATLIDRVTWTTCHVWSCVVWSQSLVRRSKVVMSPGHLVMGQS